ncbi:MAG: glycine--tRNA ligase subunit beta [Thalassococcus sp.]|uniref:glycine--tRNA ligase subunit beta n=1 Tax=Thalassococcus sp. TaxID=1928858 RepID=UPI001B06AD7C|nr:glycine--tRNA ligase subunit beta [Thalassococcus sp.]MBO6866225.1 glycine--tRNA ligase subunit beta [Thalassococcus sp.]
MSDLLIELFSEEIPARMQARASEDLKKMVTDGLVEAGLTYAHAGTFATPRRLTLTIEGLLDKSPDVREERKGPRADAPEKAIEGFLRGAGVSREDLIEREEKKGTILYAIIEKKGRPASEIVAEVLEKTIRTFPWPKSMRWGTGSLRWVRPLHRILCILTDDAGEATVVPLDVDGIQASNETEGHRFMAPGAFTVSSFDDYTTKLKRAFVLINPEERAEMIWNDATNAAFAHGLEVVEDRGLLAENAGLVEWPVTLMGAIADEYLSLPPEVLQTSMKEHQKFFSVKNPSNGRIERFITVANRETSDNGATILAGNLKVLSARLADAKFFWENDLRVAKSEGLEAWTAKLSNVTFHNKLGSQKDRIDRIAELARKIAPSVGADIDLSAKAALVVKADLSSEMVFEFPELQGLMGRYYSEAAGLPAEIANACEEHYSPLGPSDDVPTAPVSVTVALADKLDVLTGFWAIDEKPTGSKDPFALRRAALGVIRLLLTNDIRMSLSEVFGETEWSADLLSFFHDRLKVFLRDDGIRHDVIDACLAMPGNDDITLLVKRARALSDVLKTEDGENMVQGFKRANNILTQAEEKDGVEYSFGADPKFADTPEEKALFAAFDAAEGQIKPAMEREDFAAAMQAMATMRGAVDGFFEAVQVNADSDILRRNRLNMLSSIRSICLQVADLTQLEG